MLEIGTLGGYSTICLARGVGAEGSVVTLEYEPRHAEIAAANLRRAGVEVWEVERDRCVVAFRRAVVLSFATGAVCEVLWAPDGSVFEAQPPEDPDAPWHLSRASRSTLSRLRAAKEATP